MEPRFLLTTFFLGLIAAAPVGPLCILVFNRSARRGFFAGFVTGAGAAVADGIYGLLGLVGFLQVFVSDIVLVWLFRVGGVALMATGVLLIIRRHVEPNVRDVLTQYGAMTTQGFMLTICNPMVALFFMTAGVQLLSSVGHMQHIDAMMGAVMIVLGSGSVFTLSSLFGHVMRARVCHNRIAQLQAVTGGILLLIGLGMVTGVVAIIPVIFKQFLQLFS